METTPKRPNRIDTILALIDEGLAASDAMQETYRASQTVPELAKYGELIIMVDLAGEK